MAVQRNVPAMAIIVRTSQADPVSYVVYFMCKANGFLFFLYVSLLNQVECLLMFKVCRDLFRSTASCAGAHQYD